jgi:predicted nucleotide-binding protein
MSIPDTPKPILESLKAQVERGNRVLGRVPIPRGDFAMWIETVRHHLYRIYGTNSLHIDAIFPKASYKELEGRDLNALGVEMAHRLQALIGHYESISQLAGARAGQGNRVFIGHGRSPEWLRLKDFLTTKLGLLCDEFNEEATAGLPTTRRLEHMLKSARFAFLVATAEDKAADGTMHARANVVHETGLFQARLGFDRAIILLEDGCQEYSNIVGLTQLRFHRGQISSCFHEVREVLEARGLI